MLHSVFIIIFVQYKLYQKSVNTVSYSTMLWVITVLLPEGNGAELLPEGL